MENINLHHEAFLQTEPQVLLTSFLQPKYPGPLWAAINIDDSDVGNLSSLKN